jgi:DNA topoisomerase II
MVLLGFDNRPVRYGTTKDILEAFYNERLPCYDKRRQNIIDNYTKEIEKLSERINFINEVVIGNLIVMNRKKSEIIIDIKRLGLNEDLYNKIKTSSYSVDEINELKSEIDTLINERKVIIDTSSKKMWMTDLETFEYEYCKKYKKPLPPSMQFTIKI